MIDKKILNDTFLIRNAKVEDVIQMEYVQSRCYPTLHESEILNRDHFANHIKVFPEGQIVVEKDGIIVASASTFRCDYSGTDSGKNSREFRA